MTPKTTVIGVDPGGNGTTGLVVCRDWGVIGKTWWRGRFPAYPASIEAYSVKGWSEAISQFRYLYLKAAMPIKESAIACEDVAVWQTSSETLISTIQQIGGFRAVAAHVVRPFARILPVTYRSWWLGARAKNADGAIDQALLVAYGGKDVAVGGVKCKGCGGKGYTGRALKPSEYHDPSSLPKTLIPVGDKWYLRCVHCEGSKESARGFLYPLWKPKSLQHCRAALAVAVYAYNNNVWKE